MATTHSRLALVLSGGGARSAYQAGAIKALIEILNEPNHSSTQLKILTGISGGSINAAGLASGFENPTRAAEALWSHWDNLHFGQIISEGALDILFNVLKVGLQLIAGGWVKQSSSTSLLQTEPLHRFLAERLDFGNIKQLISKGTLDSLALTSTHLGTGAAVTFFQSHVQKEKWAKSDRIGLPAELSLKHVLASAAIPILFEPIRIQGSYYADGGIRMSAPLSPAFHLGADRIIAISTRFPRSSTQTLELIEHGTSSEVRWADTLGVVLNSIFLDPVESDLERAMRINDTLSTLRASGSPVPLRQVPLFAIRPSQDLGKLARNELEHFPSALRHLIGGLGANKEKGSDLLSYLAFDSKYTRGLLALGYEDVKSQKNEISSWLQSGTQ